MIIQEFKTIFLQLIKYILVTVNSNKMKVKKNNLIYTETLKFRGKIINSVLKIRIIVLISAVAFEDKMFWLNVFQRILEI